MGKLLCGSGFSDILIEAGIVLVVQLKESCLENTTTEVHKRMVETMERLLFSVFINECDIRIQLLQSCNLKDNELTPEIEQLSDLYFKYRNEVRIENYGPTAMFWMQYNMDRVYLVLKFLRATKENNFDLHLACVQEMCPLYFAMNLHNYARYLSEYYISILNLPHSHPLPQAYHVPEIQLMTIEQTINKHAKSKGGIIGFSRNYSAYYRWCITRHSRAKYVDATLEMADMKDKESTFHK